MPFRSLQVVVLITLAAPATRALPANPGEQIPAGQRAERVTTLNLPPGFAAERVYRVPRETEGSWVGLCHGPEGTLFASDQGNAGLFQIRPAVIGEPGSRTVVEKIEVPVSSAQGLCFHRGTLYALSLIHI